MRALRSLLVELLLYGTLVTLYALGVLQFLIDPLAQLYHYSRTLYAGAALVLIVGQAAALDGVTSFILDCLSLALVGLLVGAWGLPGLGPGLVFFLAFRIWYGAIGHRVYYARHGQWKGKNHEQTGQTVKVILTHYPSNPPSRWRYLIGVAALILAHVGGLVIGVLVFGNDVPNTRFLVPGANKINLTETG